MAAICLRSLRLAAGAYWLPDTCAELGRSTILVNLGFRDRYLNYYYGFFFARFLGFGFGFGPRLRVCRMRPRVDYKVLMNPSPPHGRPVRVAIRPPQRLGCRRDGHEVNVIAHQAVGPDRHAVALSVGSQQRQVALAVGFLEEDIRPPVAPLRNACPRGMMRKPRHNNACNTWHDRYPIA